MLEPPSLCSVWAHPWVAALEPIAIGIKLPMSTPKECMAYSLFLPVLIPIASLVESLKEWIAPSYACPLWIYSCPSSFELTLFIQLATMSQLMRPVKVPART